MILVWVKWEWHNGVLLFVTSPEGLQHAQKPKWGNGSLQHIFNTLLVFSRTLGLTDTHAVCVLGQSSDQKLYQRL